MMVVIFETTKNIVLAKNIDNSDDSKTDEKENKKIITKTTKNIIY